VQHDIAKSICQGWSPQLREAMELPEQATRLDRALKVAEAWMEAAREDSAEMFAQAQYTHDKLEEELSRVLRDGGRGPDTPLWRGARCEGTF
jgi:hypothetical protein